MFVSVTMDAETLGAAELSLLNWPMVRPLTYMTSEQLRTVVLVVLRDVGDEELFVDYGFGEMVSAMDETREDGTMGRAGELQPGADFPAWYPGSTRTKERRAASQDCEVTFYYVKGSPALPVRSSTTVSCLGNATTLSAAGAQSRTASAPAAASPSLLLQPAGYACQHWRRGRPTADGVCGRALWPFPQGA